MFPYLAFDHGRVWERPDGTRFLLAHVYTTHEKALAAAAPEAAARGLQVEWNWHRGQWVFNRPSALYSALECGACWREADFR